MLIMFGRGLMDQGKLDQITKVKGKKDLKSEWVGEMTSLRDNVQNSNVVQRTGY